MYDAAAPSAKLLALVQRCSIPYAEVPLCRAAREFARSARVRSALSPSRSASGEPKSRRAAMTAGSRCGSSRLGEEAAARGQRSHRGAARDVLSRGSGNSIPSLALASRPMAGADIYDVLRELDADKRFKECRLSVTRPSPLYGGHNRIRTVSIHLPSEHDPARRRSLGIRKAPRARVEVKIQVTRPASAGLERGAGWLPERRIFGSHQNGPGPAGSMTRSSARASRPFRPCPIHAPNVPRRPRSASA